MRNIEMEMLVRSAKVWLMAWDAFVTLRPYLGSIGTLRKYSAMRPTT